MRYAFGYTRFSSDNQDANSTDTQIRSIKEYAEKSGFTVVEFFNDAGVSGRTSERQEFMRMVGIIKAGKVKVEAILVYKFSRFMRNFEESLIYKRMLQRLGVKVISVTENVVEEGPVGKLLTNVLACIDQFYSDMLAGLSLEGQKEIVRNKYWPGGPPPFGYSLSKVENSQGHSRKGKVVERNVLIIKAEEAKIVKRIFEISAETGKGGHLIYKQLCNEFGGEILGRPRSKRGASGERIVLPARPMDGGSINAIIKKKIYVGLFIYNSHGFEHADSVDGEEHAKKKRISKKQEEWIEVSDESWRIVSDELWAAAQAARIANQSVRKDFGFSSRKASYALTGLIECGSCSRSFGGKWQCSSNRSFSEKSEYYYYRCRHSNRCENKSKLDGEELEAAVINAVLSQLFDEKFLIELAQEVLELSKAPGMSEGDRAGLEQRRKEISTSIDRLVELVKTISINIGEVATQIQVLENERAAIDSKLKFYSMAGAAPTVEELLPLLKKKLEQPRQLFKTEADLHALRWELGRWVETTRVDHDGQVFVKWKSKAVFDLLNLPPAGNSAESGTPYSANSRSFQALYAWHPIVARASWMAAAGVSGFSGYIGNPTTVNNSKIINFSGMAARAVSITDCYGFSGFSGQRTA